MAALAAVDGVASVPPKTLVHGITALKQGAYLLELDTAGLAAWFRSYAQDHDWDLARTCLGNSARVLDKAHNLIFCFVSCGVIFDPSSANDIAALEAENNLPIGSITIASWLKRVEN
ncbi:hypothetical protein H2248_002478 [Termitomyces sp. 'cryptogamus']|nr:hypothetical protein H2248_002478 [Termitomyces sp. 'cryptogamus']